MTVKHIALPGTDGWTLWPWSIVRSAGFPARWLEGMSAVETIALIDRYIDAEREVSRTRELVETRLRQALETALPGERSRIARTLRKIRKRLVPRAEPVLMIEWREALEQLSTIKQAFVAKFAQERNTIRASLHARAGEPRLREALAWQNPSAVRFMLDRVANASVERDDKRLRYAELGVVSYLQRYCMKNDTIGFFGPVCWARVQDTGPAFAHTAAAELIQSKDVFYEDWAMMAVCRTIDRHNAALRPWLRPRRLPVVGLVGENAYLLQTKPLPLEPVEAYLLSQCDGTRTARTIACACAEHADWKSLSESDVFAHIERLCERGLAVWRVETAMSAHSNIELRSLCSAIDDPALRARALAPMQTLDDARERVAHARGADDLITAMDHLFATFEQITGQSPTRRQGQTYAARIPVYLDARRADDVQIGSLVVQRMTGVLSIFMHAARWFTAQVAQAYRGALTDLYHRLAPTFDNGEVPLLRLWLAARSLFPLRGEWTPEPLGPIIAELHRRWQTVLDIEPNTQEQIRYASADLLPKARTLFHAERPGWALARHHGPDILIDAVDAAAIENGDFTIVMGEFHCAINSSIVACLMEQHPQREDMYRLWEADFSEPCILPGTQRERFTVRNNRELAKASDYRLEWAPDVAGAPRAAKLLAGDLIAINRGGTVSICRRDRSETFDLIEFFGQALSGISHFFFGLPTAGSYTPRIRIDDVVVARRQWKASPSALQPSKTRTPAERFLHIHQWIRAQGISRQCFVRTPIERKPIYVDFDNPLFVDLFFRLCKTTAADDQGHLLTLSEVLPAPDRLWLHDRDGNRYASEIRLVAVDPVHTEK